MECFICGVKGERTTLFNAIIRKGIVKICEDCSVKESIGVIRKINNLQLRESEKNQTVYEKLSRMAGLDPEEHKAKFGSGVARLGGQEAEPLAHSSLMSQMKQNEDLRKIINERKEFSFPDLKQVQPEAKDDLVRNYHWAVFKARRARRLTQKQVAEAIAEPESSIKLVERGVLPDNYPLFIRKIQTYLGISLFNKSIKEDKELGFDPVSSKELTIADIQETSSKKFLASPTEDVERKDKAEKDKSSSFFPYWRKKLSFFKKRREKKQEVDEGYELESQASSSEDLEREFDRILEPFNESESTKSSESPNEPLEEKEEPEKLRKDELSQEDIDKIIFGK